MKKETIELNQIIADPGKVFRRVDTGKVCGPIIYLGKRDSSDNYIEVDAPPKDNNLNQSKLWRDKKTAT